MPVRHRFQNHSSSPSWIMGNFLLAEVLVSSPFAMSFWTGIGAGLSARCRSQGQSAKSIVQFFFELAK
jgi:hypothetical protein